MRNRLTALGKKVRMMPSETDALQDHLQKKLSVINNGVQQFEDENVRRLLDTPGKVMQQLELQLAAVTAVAQKIFPTGNWDAGVNALMPACPENHCDCVESWNGC